MSVLAASLMEIHQAGLDFQVSRKRNLPESPKRSTSSARLGFVWQFLPW